MIKARLIGVIIEGNYYFITFSSHARWEGKHFFSSSFKEQPSILLFQSINNKWVKKLMKQNVQVDLLIIFKLDCTIFPHKLSL